MPSRNGYFIKLPALRLALAEYATVRDRAHAACGMRAPGGRPLSLSPPADPRLRAQVAWMDMDGYAPFAPRPATRRCVPFTRCWPDDAQMVGD